MSEPDEYILGTDRAEIERLRFQHQVWVAQAYALWDRARLCAGDVVLDLGCGPGFTSFELAHVVGPAGRVIARDESPRFLAFLRSERERLGCVQVEPSPGRVEDLELAPESLDAAYARWLLCWLPDPGAALARVARFLRPQGVIVVQDYIDWGAMKILPRSELFDRGVLACMQSWKEGVGTIDVGELVPAIAARAGLAVDHFRPVARIGSVGSLEWRWMGSFFQSYLPKLVERGTYRAEELAAWSAEWEARTAQGTSWCYTPVMVDVVLRKP